MLRFDKLFAPVDDQLFTSWLFLRLLGVIYFIAFASLLVQITGLVGPQGILPFGEVLNGFYQRVGSIAWFQMPTLFWFGAGDLALHTVCLLGCVFAVLLFLGRWQRISLIALFILYLSLYHAGQTFLNFQWDTLLLECGFLSIFLVGGPNRLVLFLFHFLLFRLRFMSGVSKLTSEDPVWADFTALNYYFETQPLPHVGSWYFHQLPDWLLRAGTGFTYFTELIVPIMIFLPRKFRIFAAAVTVLMQLIIMASSNHNFINLLTIILCLFLLDDRLLARLTPANLLTRLREAVVPAGRLKKLTLSISTGLILFSSLTLFYSMAFRTPIPSWLNLPGLYARSYGIGHIYHVFPTMQTERQELQIEGSNDGENWQAYGFKYKPGNLYQRPVVNIPHQPRLDWMIWFVPPQTPHQMAWFSRFIWQLKKGSPAVLDLLAYNPFKDTPPRHLRVMAFRYRFTTVEERAASGQWWEREFLGEFPNVEPRRP